MDFPNSKRAAAAAEAETLRTETEALQERNERLREAEDLIARMELEDAIVAGVREHMDRVGKGPEPATISTNPYSSSQRNRNVGNVRRSIVTPPPKVGLKISHLPPSIGKRHRRYVTDYRTVASNQVSIGEIDPDARDGLTHGLVEFVVEEGVLPAGRMTRKKAMKGKLPFKPIKPKPFDPIRPNGQVDLCGVRVFACDEDGQDVTPIGEFEAGLLTPLERERIAGVRTALMQDPTGNSPGVGAALNGVFGIEIRDEDTAALEEIAQMVDLATAEQQRQEAERAAAAAAPPPGVGPAVGPGPAPGP